MVTLSAVWLGLVLWMLAAVLWPLRDQPGLLALICAGMAVVVWNNWQLGSGR